MDNHPTLRKDLIEAWERYVDKTNTHDDLLLIFDSIRDENFFQEFEVVFNRKWNKAMNELPLTPEDRKEMYRKEFAQLFAEYQNKQKMQKLQTIQVPSRNIIVRFRKLWYAAAAAILLAVLIPASYHYLKPKTEQTVAVQYVEVATQRGEIKTIVLSDDTKVTLNAGSRIVYPDGFVGNDRPVELYGEALFDVTSDPARPFTVKTENMNIKVVGTIFDVKDYADDLTTSVSVASGKVEVGLADDKLMLGKNQQMKMDKASVTIEKKTFDADNYLTWTDGTLFFERTPIREVVNMLNRHFPQVDIEMADGEYYYLITGKYNNVKHPDNIIKGIAYTLKLKYKKTGNKYVLYNE